METNKIKYHYLSIEDRQEIEQSCARYCGIYRVHTATIYRELERRKTDENGKPEYSAIIGESKQKNSFRRRGRKPKKKPRKENIRDEECGYSS